LSGRTTTQIFLFFAFSSLVSMRERRSFWRSRPSILLRKYYLDIGKAEQKRRLADRAGNPLKQWKVSPIDAVAVKNWKKYSEARDEMLTRTHTEFAPWDVVRTDNKHAARLNVIKAILASLDYKGKDERLLVVDPTVVLRHGTQQVKERRTAR
jgi:hypothetical protein